MTTEATRPHPPGKFDDGPNPAAGSGYQNPPPRMGFFTDTSVCIGCKACEVACKEWNAIPEDGLQFTGMSYDNTQGLGASTWRHVAFIEVGSLGVGLPPAKNAAGEQPSVFAAAADPSTADLTATAPTGSEGWKPGSPGGADGFRWLMSSDVCKHCTEAACLDVCPTGALMRTEFGTVVVQSDVCNGCGYCVPACPFGVLDKRPDDGRVFKCTMCYDRLSVGAEPACAKTCPTESIQFGPVDELRERAERRVEQLRGEGVTKARLYGHEDDDGVGGAGAFFLLLDEPEVYGLPPDPVVTTRDLPSMWARVGTAAAALAVGVVTIFARR